MTGDSTATANRSAWPLTALVFVAVVVGLVASLANLLNHHAYPAFRPEVGVVMVGLIALAGAAAGLHRLAQPRVSFLFSGLYAAVLIDLGAEIGNMAFPLTAAVLALFARFGERTFLKLTTAAFASVLLFQSIGLITAGPAPAVNEAKRPQAATRGDPSLPPIVHLMLDSYIGLEGMSAADTHFGDLREHQQRFYLGRGFQLYPGAYGRHAKTINALPEMLSYGRARHATKPRNVQFTVAPTLDYFTDLDRKGYRASALAPSFVDLCPNQPLTRCRNYNRSDLSSMARSGLAIADRARIIATTMLELTQFTAILAGTADLKLAALRGGEDRHLYNRAKLYSLTGFAQLDAFSRDLASLRRGEARFVHLLIPHDPYMLDERCRVLPEPRWLDEHGPSAFARRDAAYARQARCMTDEAIARLLAALDATDAGRQAIVVIQGDHGSRTVDGVPFAGESAPDPRTLAVTYSAFFAIRVPGQPAQLVEGRYALDELLGGFAASGFSAAPRPAAGPARVWLMDPRWIPAKEIALPPFAQKFPKN